MINSISLSYILTTRNRLPSLVITLEKLFQYILPDEEIIIIDSDSSDGTKNYLEKLFTEGKIHQYISEPDHNQAHGWNKAMLLARGTIIKKIIDDDVFCYKAIRECKMYMLANQNVDVVISNDLAVSINDYKGIKKHSRLQQFEKWQKNLMPSFTFGDVHMLIRRSSLAYIGLYNTKFLLMDWEYSLRISYLRAKIVYYTGYNALSVYHPSTVSSTRNEKLVKQQGKRGSIFYEYKGDEAEISTWSKVKILIGKKILKPDVLIVNTNEYNVNEIYSYLYNYINELNLQGNFTFLTN